MWDVLTEDERTDLLGSFVQNVEMTEKTKAALELLPIPAPHDVRFELTSDKGARARLELATFGL